MGGAKENYSTPFRAGSMDLWFDGVASPQSGRCFFLLRSRGGQPLQWGQTASLDLAFWGIGHSLIDAETGVQVQPGSQPLCLPLGRVSPGETDHNIAETESWSKEGGTEVAMDRPLLLPLAVSKPGAGVSGSGRDKLELRVSQMQGLNFSEKTRLSVERTNPATKDSSRFAGRVFYVDRTPFFVGILDTNSYENDVANASLNEGSELLHWSSEGLHRGWQRAAAKGDFRAVLQAQGVGEAAEKGRIQDGYGDIEEGQLVDFRFTPVTLLTINASDQEQRNHGMPWNIRETLNVLSKDRLAGLPLKMASFEMLYGLRFTVKNVPYLRVAELLARYGHPRRLLALEPPHGSLYLVEDKAEGAKRKWVPGDNFKQLKRSWENMLRVLEARLAVYEVFNDRQVEFDGTTGLPVGLELKAGRGDETVTAELRKSADLRTSMPSVRGKVSAPPRQKGEIILLDPLKDMMKGAPSWQSILPNYEGGLAGSFAWAFESKLLYEMLWQDPLVETPAVVESVEATVARLYFSALGGWGTQQASFARGRVIIAVAVDMGRVSELRVEIVGRIGCFKNSAKLVTVFRRSVLPTRQFFDQQDPHYGRPLLRKAEEYVEFIQTERPLQDKETVALDPALPGALRACSCTEKVLVDSRWGVDIYDSQDTGIGWKLPLRKAGVNPHIYGPANVLLHCHSAVKGQKETTGAIENLEDVWFWTIVDPEMTDNTEEWPNMPGIDVCQAPMEDPHQPSMEMGARAVPLESAACTYRLAGMASAANLSHHLPPEPNVPPQEQRAVGATLRYVTVTRSDAGRLPNIAAPEVKETHQAVSHIRAHAENALALVEQLTSTRAGEVIIGWKSAAAKLMESVVGAADKQKALRDKLAEALRPAVSAADRVHVRLEDFKRSLEREAAAFGKETTTVWNTYKGLADKAQLEWGNAENLAAEMRTARDKIFTDLGGKVDALKLQLTTTVQSAYLPLWKLAQQANFKVSGSMINVCLRALDDLGLKADGEAERIKDSVQRSLRDILAADFEQVAEDKHLLEKMRVRLEHTIREGMAYAVAMKVQAATTEEKKLAEIRAAAAVIAADTAALQGAWEVVVKRARATLPPQAGKEQARVELQMLLMEVFDETVSAAGTSDAGKPGAHKLALKAPIAGSVQLAAQLIADRAKAAHAFSRQLALQGVDLRRRLVGLEKVAFQEELKVEPEFLKALSTDLQSACEGHVAELKKTLQTAAHTVMEEVLHHGSELRRAMEVMSGLAPDKVAQLKSAVVNYLDGSGVHTWLTTHRDNANTQWKELQKKVTEEFRSSFTMLKGKVAGSLGADAQLVEKNFQRFRSNLQHSMRQGSQALQSVANDAVRSIAQPLHQLGEALKQEGAKVESYKAELDKRLKQFVDESWGEALRGASGTVERAKQGLKQAQKDVTSLMEQANAENWLGGPDLDGLSLEQQRRHLLHRLSQVRAVVGRIEEQIKVPWFRSLPTLISLDPVMKVLRNLEVTLAIGPATERIQAFRTEFRGALDAFNLQINAALPALPGLADAAGLQNVFTNLKKDLEEGALKTLDAYVSNPTEEARKVLQALVPAALNGVHELGSNIEDAVEKEITRVAEHFNPKSGEFAKIVASTSNGVAGLIDGLGGHLKDLPSLGDLERGLPQMRDWFDQQRTNLGTTLDQLGSLKDQMVADLKGDPGKAAARLFRSFGQVPQVPGLDFHGMAKFPKVDGVLPEMRANLESRVRSIGYEFRRELGNYVKMSPVTGMVDRARNAVGQVEEAVRLKAASLEMAMRDVRRQIETDVEGVKKQAVNQARVALKDLIPDLGGLKLEKLLGAAGLSDKFLEQLKAKSKTSHGVDEKTQTMWVDSKVENLLLDEALTLFSFGPVTMMLRQTRLDSHIRIQTNLKGETEKVADGQLVADWEVSMGGQPMITYEQARLECKNGKVRMELDPNKIRMPSMLQMLADMMSSVSYKDDSGLQAGIRASLPSSVTGYVTFNMDFPPMGGGTTSIQNLRLKLLFELSLAFPRFPSMDDAHLRISAGAGLSDRESPFIIGIFILGGCGWFGLRVDYVVPFKDGKPYLEARITIAVGASASLCLNLGFASGQVYIALALEIECTVSSRGHHTYFSIALTIAGVLDILGGLISVYLVISLAITYSSGQPMRGMGRIAITIRICWCFKIKLNKSFTYTFGGGVSRKSAMSSRHDSRTPRLAESSGRIPAPWFNVPQPETAAAMAAKAACQRRAGRMSV